MQDRQAVVLPNIRKLFIPDDGYDIYDCDLSGADAQVVAWEAGDEKLKAAFRAKIDVHAQNAEELMGTAFTSLPEGSFARREKRQSNKHAVHATNYGAKPMAVARHPSINWTVHEADRFQKRWFDLHPGIGPVTRKGSWHWRIQDDIDHNRPIRNKFGYQRVYFDRPSEVFTEALAWVPQSTVALVTFKGAIQAEKTLLDLQMLLQVHDSIVFQRPYSKRNDLERLKEELTVYIPYDDPLNIPWGVARSPKSWGDCVKEGKKGWI